MFFGHHDDFYTLGSLAAVNGLSAAVAAKMFEISRCILEVIFSDGTFPLFSYMGTVKEREGGDVVGITK